LIKMLESGKLIGIYAGVWKQNPSHPSTTYCEILSFFPFSRNNHNKLYLSIICFWNSAAIVGLCSVCFNAFILFGNGINNKGKLFYTQERVGKDGVLYFKFRSMKNDSESDGAVFPPTVITE
jgi:lipopolysaccharide/colanic/teichoic acid biosynthesis glycosyltransferase